MIETRAHKEGKSKELKQVCERLVESLRKENFQIKHRKSFWSTTGFFIGLIAFFMYIFYVEIAPFYMYVPVNGILTMMGGAGVIMAFILGRSIELKCTEMHEVSADFYYDFVESAKQHPDLVILVEGQEYLTIKDARNSLQRLRCRAHIEMQNDKNGTSAASKAALDHQRVAFQALSLQNCSNSPTTLASGV